MNVIYQHDVPATSISVTFYNGTIAVETVELNAVDGDLPRCWQGTILPVTADRFLVFEDGEADDCAGGFITLTPDTVSADLNRGDVIAPVDLTPVLEAIGEIPETDLQPVLDAISGIPEVDLQPVFDAINEIPETDLTGVNSSLAGITSNVASVKATVEATATTTGVIGGKVLVIESGVDGLRDAVAGVQTSIDTLEVQVDFSSVTDAIAESQTDIINHGDQEWSAAAATVTVSEFEESALQQLSELTPNVNVTIGPTQAVTPRDVQQTTLYLRLSDTSAYRIEQIIGADGSPVNLLNYERLELIFESRQKQLLEVLEHTELTIINDGRGISFRPSMSTVGVETVDSERHLWAIRDPDDIGDDGTGRVLAGGDCVVRRFAMRRA